MLSDLDDFFIVDDEVIEVLDDDEVIDVLLFV